jgi:cardiolipin synthase
VAGPSGPAARGFCRGQPGAIRWPLEERRASRHVPGQPEGRFRRSGHRQGFAASNDRFCRDRALTVPNIITILRFILVPAVVYAMMTGEIGWAFAGFIVAGISDGVDGFIARQFDQRTELGAYLDPIADKLLLVSVFVVLGQMGELPLWLVIAVVSRDALIVGAVLLSYVMGRPVLVKPLFVSKANTTAQILLAGLVLGELSFSAAIDNLRDALIVLAGLLTIASAAAYLVAWLRHMNGDGESDPPAH